MRRVGSFLLALAMFGAVESSNHALAQAATYAPRPTQKLARQLEAVSLKEQQLRRELNLGYETSDRLALSIQGRGRSYVRLARAGLMPLSAGFDSLMEHAVKLERMQAALSRDLAQIMELHERRLEIRKQLEQIAARRRPLEAEYAAMTNAESALMSAHERELAFERAFSRDGGRNHTAVYAAGLGGSSADALASGFARLKGKLPFPLPGRTEIRASSRGTNRGFSMRGATGAPVSAVFRGRVAFADEYPEYGLTVILDHGDQYYTVSANLGSVDVRAGDEVGAGKRIGSLVAGGSLYFEVRQNTDTLDPAQWFGL